MVERLVERGAAPIDDVDLRTHAEGADAGFGEGGDGAVERAKPKLRVDLDLDREARSEVLVVAFDRGVRGDGEARAERELRFEDRQLTANAGRGDADVDARLDEAAGAREGRELTADGFDAFLARPVRRKTLARILTQVAAGKEKKQAKPRKSRAKKNAAGTRVLVAEDNEINALLVHVALSKAGYDVDIVGDGQTAVDRACTADAGYAVVLMDLHMPVMDGPEAIRHIRRHEEERGLKPVPILALTADSQSETREAVLADGATGFLTKPVDPGELSRIIADARAA